LIFCLHDSLLCIRCSSLVQVNTILREQLDQAHLVNQQLTEDLRRITHEFQQVRDDLSKKTRDWKEEERVSSKRNIYLYFST
jgi:hypothetical protein